MQLQNKMAKVFNHKHISLLFRMEAVGLTRRSQTDLSKAMSYLLRHGAQKEKVPIDEKGFISVSNLLKHKSLKRFNENQLDYVIKSCPKQRFFSETREDGMKYIRANQGHSLANVSVDMEEITDPTGVVAVHGTYFRPWNSIKATGLSKMSRQHIHLSAGEPGSTGVISGMRQTAEVMVYVNVPLAMQDGVKFYRSANNVILTSGFDGILPTKYFSKVLNAKTREELPLD